MLPFYFHELKFTRSEIKYDFRAGNQTRFFTAPLDNGLFREGTLSTLSCLPILPYCQAYICYQIKQTLQTCDGAASEHYLSNMMKMQLLLDSVVGLIASLPIYSASDAVDEKDELIHLYVDCKTSSQPLHGSMFSVTLCCHLVAVQSFGVQKRCLKQSAISGLKYTSEPGEKRLLGSHFPLLYRFRY